MDDRLGAGHGPDPAASAVSAVSAETLADLAEALGMPAPPAEACSGAGLSAFLSRAALAARELSESERRSRQAANGFRASGMALSSSLVMEEVLEALLDYLNWAVPFDGATVLLGRGADESGGGIGALRASARREWRRETARDPSLEEFALAELSVREDRPVLSSAGQIRRLALPLLGPEGPVGAVLVIRDSEADFAEHEVRAAEAFAGQAAVAVRNAALFGALAAARDELLSSYDASIELLSRALDLRDHETEGHSLRVANLSVRLGEAAGLSGEALLHLRRGALLHDIGKIGIPDAVLRKPGCLDAEELAVMRRHPRFAWDLLSGIGFLAPSLDVPVRHHERWDGSGYPDGLRGLGIPLPARIFAVVDVWDALVHDRPYRAAMSREEARAQLEREAGSVLDPELVGLFLSAGIHSLD